MLGQPHKLYRVELNDYYQVANFKDLPPAFSWRDWGKSSDNRYLSRYLISKSSVEQDAGVIITIQKCSLIIQAQFCGF